MESSSHYRDLRLDGPLAEFHHAIDRLRWDTVSAPLNHQPPAPPARPHRRRPEPGDGQARLDEEAS